MKNVEFRDRQVFIDGVATQIRSGAMHYFRILPEQWRERIASLRACGLNTLETYVAWNFHEPREGEFDFTGRRDLVSYIRLAGEAGLHVIVRPGPYICSEWDLGALPAWLLTKPGRLRSTDSAFLAPMRRYFHELLPRLNPLLHTNGGPIIAMQVENEYGSVGCDKAYLEAVRDCFLAEGVDVPLFTSDGADDAYLKCGTLDGVFATVNLRNHPAAFCEKLRQFRPDDPPMVMELWDGAGLHWGEDAIDHRAADVAADIREAMEKNLNFNLYMFHGGTNFGFMNGANGANEPYRPLLTSYDVDGALPEGGVPGEKYAAVRREIQRALPDLQLPEPPVPRRAAYGDIEFTEAVELLPELDALSHPVAATHPPRFEELGCYYGFVLYRFHSPVGGILPVVLHDLRDRAQLFADGRYAGTFYRNDAPCRSIYVKLPPGGGTLDLLVENMGRINFSSLEMRRERKGLAGLSIGPKRELENCVCFPLPLDDLSKLRFGALPARPPNVPAFYRGTFEVAEVADTYIRVPSGTKGAVWLNGFNLGRYWNIGPQYTLYAPAPLLRRGRNELIVFELEHLGMNRACSVTEPDLGRRVVMPLN